MVQICPPHPFVKTPCNFQESGGTLTVIPLYNQKDCTLSHLIHPHPHPPLCSKNNFSLAPSVHWAASKNSCFPRLSFPPQSLQLTTGPVGTQPLLLLMQSEQCAATTHPLPLQTSILEPLNNSCALCRHTRIFRHSVKFQCLKLCKVFLPEPRESAKGWS